MIKGEKLISCACVFDYRLIVLVFGFIGLTHLLAIGLNAFYITTIFLRKWASKIQKP